MLKCFDLKVIIILVIIDFECFFKYFDNVLIIEVFGCIFFVEVCYRLIIEINKDDMEVDGD